MNDNERDVQIVHTIIYAFGTGAHNHHKPYNYFSLRTSEHSKLVFGSVYFSANYVYILFVFHYISEPAWRFCWALLFCLYKHTYITKKKRRRDEFICIKIHPYSVSVMLMLNKRNEWIKWNRQGKWNCGKIAFQHRMKTNEHVFNNISAIWHILPWVISSYISYYTIILLLYY